MKVLVLDDEPARHQWFRAQGWDSTHVTRVQQAVDLLGGFTQWDRLYLDHDLGHDPPGRHVAFWLIEHPEAQPSLCTVVHSVNEVSGPKIVREMRQAGRPCVWMPFPILMQQGWPHDDQHHEPDQ